MSSQPKEKQEANPRRWSVKALNNFAEYVDLSRKQADLQFEVDVIDAAIKNGSVAMIPRKTKVNLKDMVSEIIMKQEIQGKMDVSVPEMCFRRGKISKEICKQKLKAIPIRAEMNEYLTTPTRIYAIAKLGEMQKVIYDANAQKVKMSMAIVDLEEKTEENLTEMWQQILGDINGGIKDILVADDETKPKTVPLRGDEKASKENVNAPRGNQPRGNQPKRNQQDISIESEQIISKTNEPNISAERSQLNISMQRSQPIISPIPKQIVSSKSEQVFLGGSKQVILGESKQLILQESGQIISTKSQQVGMQDGRNGDQAYGKRSEGNGDEDEGSKGYVANCISDQSDQWFLKCSSGLECSSGEANVLGNQSAIGDTKGSKIISAMKIPSLMEIPSTKKTRWN